MRPQVERSRQGDVIMGALRKAASGLQVQVASDQVAVDIQDGRGGARHREVHVARPIPLVARLRLRRIHR